MTLALVPNQHCRKWKSSIIAKKHKIAGIFPTLSRSSYHLNTFQRDEVDDSIPLTSTPMSPPPPPPNNSSTTTRISPAVLFIIVIVAVIFFISGLLHLLVRFLLKKHHHNDSSLPTRSNISSDAGTGGEALQRQLQQLFHLHDAGLDQAFIDALPVFLYKEIVGVGAKEPFDCAVCLCEFAEDDKLRLLPHCGHAFHIDCIDTWLLSNSTCPLCRGALLLPGLAFDNPMFEFDDVMMQEERLSCCSREDRDGGEMLFPVRLGKFKNLGRRDSSTTTTHNIASVGVGVGENGSDAAGGIVRREEGESSSSSLDARRCYSMGSYQYVLADASLQVSLCSVPRRSANGGRGVRTRPVGGNSVSSTSEVLEGKKISARSKGDSFSVSKIWQWQNNKGKLPALASDMSAMDGGLPWARRSVGDT